MWRTLLLLLLAIAGCGETQPTPHEKYLAAVAEFDRTNSRAKGLALAAADCHLRASMADQFFGLSDSMVLSIPLPRYVRHGEGADSRLLVPPLLEAMSEVIAARNQSKNLQSLREKAEKARVDWIASKRPT
jgi:hypothetical protein